MENYYSKKAQTFKNIFIFICILILITLIFRSDSNKYKIFYPFLLPYSFQNSKVETKNYEVFGFAPYWNINKLENVRFGVLTTFAYFDIPVDGEGNFVIESPGYQTFISDQATNLFKKAHLNGTRVVVTFTQMNNYDIESLVNSTDSQKRFIQNAVNLVKKRGLDGINIDFEYVGDSGDEIRNKFSNFMTNLTKKLHNEVPGSKLTVSVYASSAKDPKIYDLSKLSKETDGIFMMAYDFATADSDNAIPTSPLYGHKNGKYWYDVSTAVDDFLKIMDASKLILGLPWYGYDYPVYKPEVKAETYQGYYYYYWVGRRRYLAYSRPPTQVQTYKNAQDEIRADATGWDDDGKVGWKAYLENGIWRILFVEDVKSLKIKYNFAKNKNLAGIGVWALGFDSGKNELWSLLKNEFGVKPLENQIANRKISEI